MDYSLIFEAIEKDDLPTLKTLAENSQFSHADFYHQEHTTLLHEAITHYAEAVLQYLVLKPNTGINLKDLEGDTPLHLAVQVDYPEAVTLLINQKDIELNAKNDEYFTPLYIAAAEDLGSIAEQLITCGADPNAPDNYGQTPLHTAAWNGHIRPVSKLLSCLAINANQTDNAGYTFLHLAAMQGFLEVFKLPRVIEKCDFQLQDVHDNTVLDITIAMGGSELVELLMQRGVNCSELSEYLLFERCLDEQNLSLFRHALLSGFGGSLIPHLEAKLPEAWVHMQQQLTQKLEKVLQTNLVEPDVAKIIQLWPTALALQKETQQRHRPTESLSLENHLLHYRAFFQGSQKSTNSLHYLEDDPIKNIFYQLQLRKHCPPEVILMILQWVQDMQNIETLMSDSSLSHRVSEALYFHQCPSECFYHTRFTWHPQ